MTRRRTTDWKAAATALAAAIPRSAFHRDVLAWTDGESSRTTWWVALSGGSDSVALLLLLWSHWPERRRHLRALHFNHRLRRNASTADAKFCAQLCAALEVPLVSETWSRPAGSTRPSEAEARAARMAFFERHTRVLWLGHQQDDVAETMLMRLARGSGVGGLSAPRPVQRLPRGRVHLRPLLTLRKASLVARLRDARVPWREDATNVTPDYFRNRVRSSVVPAWAEAAQRDAIAGAAHTRDLLAEDDEALTHWLERLAPLSRRGELLLSRLKGKPRALWRRALHSLFRQSPRRIDVSRQAFERLLNAAMEGRPTRHSLGGEVFGVVSAGRLRLELRKRSAKFQRGVN